MSKLAGLSIIAKDLDSSNKEVRFINIDNTSFDQPIFISGTATDIYQSDGITVKRSDIDNIAHGKFSKLSLVNNSLQAIEESSDIKKGEANYVYVDIETGQLKTNSFSELFENHILDIYTRTTLVLKDNVGQNITLTGEQLKLLKDLLSPL